MTCLLQKTVFVGNIDKSLTGEIRNILYFCWGHRLPSCLLESVQSQTPGRKEESHWPLPQGAGLPLGTGGLSSWMQTERGDREDVSVLSFQMNKPGTLCWVLTSPSHTFSFSVYLPNITVHQSLIFLSELLETKNKKSKIFFFQTHCF